MRKQVFLAIVILYFFDDSVVRAGCTYNNTSLDSLKTFFPDDPWATQDSNFTYEINLCSPLVAPSPCKNGAAVCRRNKDGTEHVTIGKLDGPRVTFQQKSELWLSFTGDQCNDGNSNHTATFYLKCGHGLGSPVVVHTKDCSTFFEWYTTAMCKYPDEGKPISQVKCYAYNDGQKIDLNRLSFKPQILSIDDTTEFKFSVCRGLGDDRYSGKETAAVMIYKGKESGPRLEVGGKPQDNLQRSSDGKLSLTYTSDGAKPEQCTNLPRTTITFICPERGGSKEPQLIAHDSCEFAVIWETEHACPEDTLISDTCTLISAQHGVDVDLTSLQKSRDEGYYTTSHTWIPENGTPQTYDYTLNICGTLESCGNPSTNPNRAACQRDHDVTGDVGIVTGTTNKELRYVDGELTLTYRGGKACHHNNFQRETVITFECNSETEETRLEFIKDDECTYWFSFLTPLACFTATSNYPCSFSDGDKNYDLGVLQKTEDEDWQVMTGNITPNRFWMNMCGAVLKTGCAQQGLPSACMHDESGYKNIGKLDKDPVISDDKITVTYTDGDDCAAKPNTKYSSTIRLLCVPGVLDTPPVLVNINECSYEFEWRTAAACVRHNAQGTHCRVYDEQQGYDFDLTSLQKENGAYDVTIESYIYKINVCGPVPECGEEYTAGACQTSKDSSRTFNTGQANDFLKYENGILKLEYTDGTPYSDETPRRTELVFICDESVEVGSPAFATETDHTYTFQWYTRLACPAAVGVECTAKNDSVEYDLSSLSYAGKNWIATSDTTKYYIRVCGPLIIDYDSPESSCARGAAVCSIDGNVVANLGKATARPVIDDDGLRLTYSEGSVCKDGKKFETVVNLKCVTGEFSANPEFITIRDECTYVFEWSTQAACPLGSEDSTDKPCTVKDDKSDFVFNLMPLKKDGGYSISHLENTYLINICGTVTCPQQKGDPGDVAVCADTSVIGKFGTNKLEYFDENVLTLTYEGPDSTKTIIRFICDDSVAMGEPKFVQKDGDTYEFEFATSLACPPGLVDCSIVDAHGNEYDLTSLQRTDDNWKTEASLSTTYYINVCAPLVNKDITNHCSEGIVAGCQVTSGNHYSMGYVQSRPNLLEDGTIVLQYLNGQHCHVGDPDESWRSTLITFICSKLEKGPAFVAESATCEYEFKWETPAACPSRPTGTNCTVTDPMYGTDFNLGALRKTLSNYRVSGGGHWYELNVCGPLVDVTREGCNQDVVAICQTNLRNTTHIDVGHSSHEIAYSDGQIILEYKEGSGQCHNLYERHTVITFVCDFGAAGTNGPVFVEEDDECTYYFEWPTYFACPSNIQTLPSCELYTEDGLHFDLSALTRSSSNYEVAGPMGSNKKFLLNICGPIVPGKGATCPPNSAACLVDSGNNIKRFSSIGDLPAAAETVMKQENGHIVLEYTSPGGDDPCTTEIVFICGGAEDFNSMPYYSSAVHPCKYTFMWTTPEACDVDSKPNQPEGTGCVVTNPDTGHEFDLSGLKKASGYTIDDNSGHDFTINVCEPLHNSACGKASGACQSQQDHANRVFNAGNANNQLMYNDGSIYLNYTDGQSCHDDKFSRNTVIEFVCGSEALGEPVYILEAFDCTYRLRWHTALLCEKRFGCGLEVDGHTINLVSLYKKQGYYIATSALASGSDVNAVFYLNLCAPLNPIPGVLCPAGAAVCMVPENGDPKSLGQMKTEPLLDPENKKIVVEYVGGDACDVSSDMHLTSTIIFICEPGYDQGNPELVSINGCEYEFQWRTNVVCPEEEKKAQSDCTYMDDGLGYMFDFSSLSKAVGSYEMTGQGANPKTYTLNVCGTAEGCQNDASVCIKDGATYGKLAEATFVREDDNVKLAYGKGDTCAAPNDKLVAIILFTCDEHSTASTPTVSWEEDCQVTFEWKTALACAPIVQDCRATDGSHLYDLGLLSRSHGSWQVAESDGGIYWFNLCQSVHNVPGCPKSAAVCYTHSFDSSAVTVMGTLNSEQIKFKGDHVIVTYSGEAVCNHNNKDAQVELHMLCGKTIGRAKLTKKIDDNNECLFKFEWKTNVACTEEREILEIHNWVLTEPTSGEKIDLQVINDGKDHKDVQSYVINLISSSNEWAGDCEKAAICNKNQSLSIGDRNTAKYYFEGNMVEIVYTTERVCEFTSDKKISSVIDLICPYKHENNMEREPVFEYQSQSCVNVFYWYTNEVCSNITESSVRDQHSSASLKSGSHANAAAIVVSVLLIMIVALILGLIFRNPNRRTACLARARGFLGRGSNASYRYSELSGTGSGDRNGLLVNADHDYGSGSGGLPTFGRDSDDDLML